MIAYLQKSEGSEGFHQIIDFLNASHIQYALIENPIIYVSFIKQFWSTATARTTFTASSTSQPSNIHTTPVTEEAASMPHESPLQSVHLLGRDEGSLGDFNRNKLDLDAKISLVLPHDAEIQEKISSDTEVLLEKEETTELVEEPTELVEDQGSGKKGEQEVTTADTALNTSSVPISTVSATPEVSTTAANLVYIERVQRRGKIKYGIKFIHFPMDSEEKSQRLKRAGQDVEAKPAKRQRTKEVSESVQEQTDEEPKTDELPQEQLNQMVIIVPNKGINIEALQTKYPIIGWEVYSEDTMQFWKIIRVDNHTETKELKCLEASSAEYIRRNLRFNSCKSLGEAKWPKLSTARPKLSTGSTKIESMKLEAMFQCIIYSIDAEITSQLVLSMTTVSLDLSKLATTINRLERSIQTGINKWYQSLLRNSEVLPPKTAEEILARERERKARTTLLMSIPEDHLAKFQKMIDAKDMWEAIKSRFGGNDESKKMQKYILKQQFESFSIHGAGVSTEDANQKFLRSLPVSWSQVSLIMRTKPGVDTLSFDDLYNNLKVFESNIKVSIASSSRTQNVAFVSSESTNSTNDVSTAYGVSTSSGYNSQKEGSSSYTDELKNGFEMASGHDFHQIEEVLQEYTGRKLQFDAKEPVGFDKTKEPKALVTLDGEGIDWTSYAEDEQENFALMAYSNLGSDTKMSTRDKSRSSDVEDSLVYDRFAKFEGMHAVPPPMTGNYMPPKSDLGIDNVETLESVLEPVVVEPKVVRQPKVWSDAPIIEEYESYSDDEYVIEPSKEQEKPSFAFVNTFKHVKTPRETVKEKNTCSPSPKVNKRDWNGSMSKRLGLGYGFSKKACFVCGSFSHLIRYNDFHEKRMAKQVELNKQKVNTARQNPFSQAAETSTAKKVNTARQNPFSQVAETSTTRKVNTAGPIVNEIRLRNNFYKSHSPIRRPFNKSTVPKAKFKNNKVNTVGDKTISAIRETAVEASASYNWRPKRHYWNKVYKYNSGSNSNKIVNFKDPLGRPKSAMAWVLKRN
ncbi:hypothetical protein Tco_0755743 [Tanacetum coccineum]